MRTAISLGIFLLCGLIGTSPDAAAADATLDGVSIRLPPPAGFCDLTPDKPMDKIILDDTAKKLTSSFRLLAMSADCRQLAEFRSETGQVADLARVQTLPLPPAPQITLKAVCDGARKQAAQDLSGPSRELKSKLEAAAKQLAANSSTVGFLGEDATGCYQALLQKLRRTDGSEITRLSLVAIILIKNRYLSFYRSTPDLSAATVVDALAKHRASVAAVLAANR